MRLSLRGLLRAFLLFLLTVGLLAPASVLAQDDGGSNVALAKEYVRKGENEKAVFLFSRLRADEQTAPNVLPDYLGALQALHQYKDAEKLVKKAIRQRPQENTYGVALGSVYAAAGDQGAATKQYERVLDQLTTEQVVPVAVSTLR